MSENTHEIRATSWILEGISLPNQVGHLPLSFSDILLSYTLGLDLKCYAKES